MSTFKIILLSLLCLSTVSIIHAAHMAETPRVGSRAELAAALVAQSAAPEPFAPTRAYLDQPELLTEVNKQYAQVIGEHRTMVQKILNNEQRYCAKYVPLYHSQMSLLSIISDFLGMLYTAKTGKQLPADFLFLRHPSVATAVADVNSWLTALPKQMYRDYGNFNDTDERVYKVLLPVNFSLWGNTTFKPESTFEFFKENFSESIQDAAGLEKVLQEIFTIEQLDPAHIKDLITLAQEYATKCGVIYQIFVPRKLVDTVLYLSKPWGVPSDGLYDVDGYLLDKHHYDRQLERYSRCSGVLDRYCGTPRQLMREEFDSERYVLDMVQGRLLLQPTMLSPESDVKIVKYSTMSQEPQAAYTAKLHALCMTIFGKPIPATAPQAAVDDHDEKSQHAWIESALHTTTLTDRVIKALRDNNADQITHIWQTELQHSNVALDDMNNTILHFAVIEGKTDIVTMLIQKFGENPNQKNRNLETPLMLVATFRCVANPVAMLRGLITNGASSAVAYGCNTTLIHNAIYFYQKMIDQQRRREAFEIISTLIECGADIKSESDDGTTPLITAIRYKHADLVQLLLSKGLDVNARTGTWQETALQIACAMSSATAVVRTLLDHKADPTMGRSSGGTPLHEAAQSGEIEVMTLLLQHGANPGARGKQIGISSIPEKTPADVASDAAKKELLLQAVAVRKENLKKED